MRETFVRPDEVPTVVESAHDLLGKRIGLTTSLGLRVAFERNLMGDLAAADATLPRGPEGLSLALFGEQDYADGGGARPLLGIDTHTGEVVGLDPERDSCLYLLNTNLEAFIRMFTLFDNFVRLRRGTVAELSSGARAIEPSAFDRSAWAMLLELLRSAPA